MHFFRDCCVSSVLESSCIILYTAVLRAALTPQGGTEVLTLMYKDVLYAGFAGAKTGHEKITIFRGTLKK